MYVGCMAERLKTKILETDKMVDLVAGPGEREIQLVLGEEGVEGEGQACFIFLWGILFFTGAEWRERDSC